MSLILMVNFMLSLIFVMLSHPLSLGLLLLCQTIMISLITGNLCPSFWFSYILFLILVGGMLILFIYMTSVASNEKFSLSFKIIPLIFIPMLTTVIPEFPFKIFSLNKDYFQISINPSINMSIVKYISSSSNLIMAFMILYLFIALIAVVKITKFKSGSLRQMN